MSAPTPTTAAITKYYKLRVYVGPGNGAHYAAQARAAGFTDVLEGTEHVYGTLAGAPIARGSDGYGDEQCLRQRAADLVYGCAMAGGWRDATILGRY